jgi:hypothetical protein
MTSRQQKDSQEHNQGLDDTSQTLPKYPRPKILLIDLDAEAETVLSAEGFNIATGSFGTPYRVQKDDGFDPVIVNGSLPANFTEQEIVVIDLIPSTILDEVEGEKHTTPGKKDWWASRSVGVIDPRPRLMAQVRDDFQRILSHGGAFVVFSAMRYQQKLIWGHVVSQGYFDQLREQNQLDYHTWSFLSTLDRFEVENDFGQEIRITLEKTNIGRCLSDYIDEAIFKCTFYPKWEVTEEPWFVLATNKYDAPVAGAIRLDKQKPGWVFLFPQIQNKASFLTRFFNEVLPDLSPHLFPHTEGARWVQRSEYELPQIIQLNNEIRRIQEEANQQITELEEAIRIERENEGYLHVLLTETGRSLVIAVKQTLETLGFQSVIDVDEEMEKRGDTGPKREDLQIHDKSPTLLVEVKGISGLPRDADALQVWKYIAPRMKEWDRTDIAGLSIVNHRKNLPALDRENRSPFREDIITNAEEQAFGLLTTWDLFRLVRGYLKHHWTHGQVEPLFYQNGRIEPIPTHYEFIGVVEHFWPKVSAVGVRVEEAELRLGDRLAFELPVEFEEQDVESLQVDRTPVEQVDVGQLAGIQTHLTTEQIKKGMRVFRLKKK